MTRKRIVAGNWKMFTNHKTARELASAISEGSRDAAAAGVEVVICPPFPWLGLVAECLHQSHVKLGAQNVYPADEGAFTGEVSPTMLRDIGCSYVILGHSERRHGLDERDDFINRKVHASLNAGLTVIFCVGETLEERELDLTESILNQQILRGLRGVQPHQLKDVVVAYEPVWAIGTGQTASPEQAQSAHAFIRQRIRRHLGSEADLDPLILYGGSVKPDNASALMSQPDVDGALVGGASLKAETFLPIIHAAITAAR
jgi:triosephosphate isomerase